MTRAERLKRARAFHRVQERQRRAAQASLRRELSRAVEAAAAAFPNWKATIQQHRSRLFPVFEGIAVRAAAAGSVHARESIGKLAVIAERKRAPTEQELSKRIRQWAKAHAAKRVAAVSATTRRRINTAVADGLRANDPPAEIARRIKRQVMPQNPARAMTIARTETAQAMMVGQDEAVMALGEQLDLAIYKTWTATADERTRESHLEADGQTVKNDDTFTVGGAELRFPSDPNGPPEEVINCRCVIIYDAR